MPGVQPPERSGTAAATSPLPADALLRARTYGQTLGTVVRGLPLGVVTAVPSGAIAFADATFAELLGYAEPAALEGQNIFALTHPDDRVLDEAFAAQVLHGVRQGYAMEKRFIRADGGVARCAISATVVNDASGAPDFAFGIVQDISTRKAAEEAAAQALVRAEEGRRILEAVMAYVPEGITIADAPDVRIRMVSAYGAALAGRQSSALEGIPAGRHPEAWGLYRADEVTRASADALPLTRATLHGEVVKDEEWVLERPDGTRVTVLCNAGPIRDAEGRVVGGVIAWRDIDERKRAAKERERLLEETRAARDVAEAALRSRDALLARVTHDLRTPIAANYGYASLMRDGIPEPLPGSHGEHAKRMLANQQHMMALIDRLLDFARGQLGEEGGAALDVVHVTELLAAVESLLGPQLREAGLDFDSPASDPALLVRADRTRAVQILVNLVGNAIKLTPRGGQVALRAMAAEEGQVRITIADTGSASPSHSSSGSSSRSCRRTPRRRAPKSGSRRRGVPAASAWAWRSAGSSRAMGGGLSVTSAEGRGSTFALTLPRVVDAAVPSGP